MKSLRDITAEIGPLVKMGEPSIPMYSFDRPATIFWQGVYDSMRAEGCNHQQVVDWLQSKFPRWALDGELGSELEDLGQAAGRRFAAEAKA